MDLKDYNSKSRAPESYIFITREMGNGMAVERFNNLFQNTQTVNKNNIPLVYWGCASGGVYVPWIWVLVKKNDNFNGQYKRYDIDIYSV